MWEHGGFAEDYPGIVECNNIPEGGTQEHSGLSRSASAKTSPRVACGSMAAMPRTIQVGKCNNIPEGGTQEYGGLSR
jgi:hypothetical protein